MVNNVLVSFVSALYMNMRYSSVLLSGKELSDRIDPFTCRTTTTLSHAVMTRGCARGHFWT